MVSEKLSPRSFSIKHDQSTQKQLIRNRPSQFDVKNRAEKDRDSSYKEYTVQLSVADRLDRNERSPISVANPNLNESGEFSTNKHDKVNRNVIKHDSSVFSSLRDLTMLDMMTSKDSLRNAGQIMKRSSKGENGNAYASGSPQRANE